MSNRTRQVHLVARPQGMPRQSDFRTVAVDIPQPRDGEVVVRNLAMSVDPYMRPRMDDVPSYIPPFELDAPLSGAAVGEVVESADASRPVGTLVAHSLGWREHAVLDASHTSVVVDDVNAPPSYYLGVLGMPGLTAYAGLREVARFRSGDVLFVSGAAGAVGSLVGQFGRLMGASRVVGSAGTAEKVDLLQRAFGFDTAFNYRDGSISRQLAEAAPDGIDVYFDNVGGEHFVAALDRLRMHGRIAVCGTISGYNATERSMLRDNLFRIVANRLQIQGFISTDHAHLTDEFRQTVRTWLTEGRLDYRETVTIGLDHAVDAFLSMLQGGNIGKSVVNL